MSDIERLEQRIAALESRIGSGSAQFQSPGGSGSPGSPGPGGAATPAEWIAGVIASAFPQGAPGQSAQGQANAQLFAVESVLWCTSRFVCATMSCGGSGWC